jgi:hypothetical protein
MLRLIKLKININCLKKKFIEYFFLQILVIILLGKLALDPIINCGIVLEEFMNQVI